MQIQLTSENSVTEEQQQQVFELPVAIGRHVSQLPKTIDGQQVSPVVLLDGSNEISRFHALISFVGDRVQIEDKSSNGTWVNQQKLNKQTLPLDDGDTIRIGNYSITVTLLQIPETQASSISNSTLIFNAPTEVTSASELQPPLRSSSTIFFNPDTDLLEPAAPQPAATPSQRSFPPADLFAADKVSLSAIRSTGIPTEEVEYASLGGGMGSFVWVDTMRVAGVEASAIAVVSLQKKPYGRYETLLRNCQIPRYKRIRSGSDSCPDNIWGFPGYALREAWRKVFTGQILEAFYHLWQVFAEPALADTYTPHGDNVFNSMDREARRIGWDRILRYGSIRSIRKTEDGRYCIAYSASQPGRTDHRFLIARYVHLCTGYPALKLLPDLQRYREETGDIASVVQGYEPHDQIYENLERHGGMVIIRGSGIVASQIMDRLYKARKINPNIQVTHMNREPRRGNRFGLSKRHVENDWEFQPYNWPKGTWGGEMRKMLEEADPLRRRELLEAWGGTTTASRSPWRKIVQEGLDQKWYQIRYGLVKKVERKEQGKLLTTLISNQGELAIEADYIIDCTGLISDPRENPVLDDLITHYNLDLNPQGRLHVENDFEIKKMQNNDGRMYGAGVITLGGPYAPVDTFLGLQYAAHRSVEALAGHRAPSVNFIVGLHSFLQWIKWINNQRP
jgi:pSer/pThr/pTyr-binding forkhead associated (FHA) protein